MSISLHTFLHATEYQHIPDEALDWARLWMLDLLGVAVGGVQTDLSHTIRSHVTEHFGAGSKPVRLMFDGRAASPVGAALAGGMTIDALDAHDGHKLTKGHVGCGILPALFAFAEAEHITDDRAFLSALVVGYEIGTRAGIALHETAKDYHTSGAWVSVAVAAMGARLLALPKQATRDAIGIAEYHGPRSQMMRVIDHPTMLKDGSGWGAMSGVSAAYLAKDGFTGAPAISVEGNAVADLWADLGQNWRIREQYFKAFPICRWAQPPVQAVLDLRTRHGVTAQDVDRIEVTTFHESKRLATRNPTTTEEAQYSTAFPVAVAMVRGRVSPADITDGAFDDPEIRRLARGLIVTEDDRYNAAFPARRIARVSLTLKDGRTVRSEDTEAFGDPERPVSLDDVRAKFFAYAEPGLGAVRATALEDAVAHLGHGAGLNDVLDLVMAPVEKQV